MRVLLVALAVTACLGWVLPRIATAGDSEPQMPNLHIELSSYAGFDYACHIENQRMWWEFDGRRLAPQTLTAEQVRLLHQRIRNIEFMRLPSDMVRPVCDSSDTLTVTIGTESHSVHATTSYEGPLSRAHARFRSLVELIQQMNPPPFSEFIN